MISCIFFITLCFALRGLFTGFQIWGTCFETRGSINLDKMNNQLIFVRIATVNDIRYVDEIIKETAASAISRGTGIARRTPESVAQKMRDGKAVIA